MKTYGKTTYLIWGVTLIFIGLALWFGSVIYHTTERDLAEQVNNQQLILAKEAAAGIQEYLMSLKRELKLLATMPEQLAGFSWEKTPLFFQGLLDAGIVDIWGIDVNNRLVAGLVYRNPQDAFVERVLKQIKPGNNPEMQFAGIFPLPTNGTDTDKAVVMVTKAFPSGTSEHPIVYLALLISVDKIIQKFISPIRSGHAGFGWLLDENGILLYHPEHPEMIDRSVFDTGARCPQCHKAGFFLERNIVQERKEGFTRYLAAGDKDKLIAYSPINIAKRNWTIVVSAPYSDVIHLAHRNFRNVTLFLLVIIGSTLVISIVVFNINKRRTQAEEKARYADRLEREVQERTVEIEQEQHKLDDIVKAIGAELCVIDHNFRILWANEKVTKRFGPLERIGLTYCYQTIYGREDTCPDCPAVKTMSYGQVAQTECSAEDNRRYYQITTTPISDPDGKVIQVLELTQDITTQKLQEQSLINSKKLMAVGQLSVGLAHDLGNPLTIISGSAQFCLKNLQPPENVREHLEVINRNVTAANKVIKALLQFARPSVKKELSPVNLADLVEKSLLLLRSELSKKDIQIEQDFPPNMHLIQGDRSQLEQVIVNIILNSIEAIPQTGGKIWISLSEDPEKQTVSLVFTDNGCGIQEEFLDSIFEPFFTTRIKGVGLGLSISRQIIEENHHGRLTASNCPGKGAQFTLQFPWGENSGL